MATELLYPVLFGLGAFTSTLSGGLLVIRSGSRFRLVTAFAAGVLVAVPLFDLLPEAITLGTSHGVAVEHLMYAAALGFIFLLIVERYVSIQRVCDGEVCRNVRHLRGGVIGASELVGHSFLDGFAIGLGFHVDMRVGVIIAAAVIAHDFSDGINTVTLMLRSGAARRAALTMLLLDAAAPVAGAVTGRFIAFPEWGLALLLAFFGGGFLYLGAGDLLPEAHENNPPLAALLLGLAGFALIFIVTGLLRVGQ